MVPLADVIALGKPLNFSFPVRSVRQRSQELTLGSDEVIRIWGLVQFPALENVNV